MLEIEDLPSLRDPVLLGAFEGWNDAGEAATNAVAHVAKLWRAEAVAALDPEDYYDFQVNRPRVVREQDARHIVWPTTKILLARDTPLDRDVLLIDGVEPSTRWRAFTAEILDYADLHGVGLVITLGALLADVPHTRPVPVTTSSPDPEAWRRFGAEESRYEGPTGIVGVLGDSASRVGMTAVSCWAALPHYAGGAPSPKATLALLSRLEDILDVTIPRPAIIDQARVWEQGVDELAASDSEIADYIHSLEEATDGAQLPEASGDAIAREFERYLRRRDNPPSAP